jgi:hypothetical protein
MIVWSTLLVAVSLTLTVFWKVGGTAAGPGGVVPEVGEQGARTAARNAHSARFAAAVPPQSERDLALVTTT